MGQNDGRSSLLLMLVSALSGCGMNGGLVTTVGPDYQEPLPRIASRWQPDGSSGLVAHGGKASELRRWWARFGDPVLDKMLAAAEDVSSSVAEAAFRIEEARTGRVVAEAAGLPDLNTNLGSNWSSYSFGGPAFQWTRHQIGLQSNWEVDLFGGIARERQAAQSLLEARQAAWHNARVAVAVEVADAYLDFRHCELVLRLIESDADSRQQTARLSQVAGQAGLRSPADVALAVASAADGRQSVTRQIAQCDLSVKGLVALTGLPEGRIRQWLAQPPERVAKLPEPPPFLVESVPARVLQQRPDIAEAEREVAEASANIGVQLAKRFPKLSLSGNITPILQNVNAGSYMLATTWAVGPTLSLPLFDAGKRAAEVDSARARYTASVSKFQAAARTAVKEVEQALVRLQSVAARIPEAKAASRGYGTNFEARIELYRIGLGSLIDSESSRRQFLQAERDLADLERERVAAWIALYRAVGGSWGDADLKKAGGTGAGRPLSSSYSCCSLPGGKS